MKAPSDPFLRAIWLVSNLEDVTPTEASALLAFWRFFAGEKKHIGPTLLGFLLGVDRENAKSIMRRLTEKGYVGSDGKQGYGEGSGRRALRWLTRKANLPNMTKRGQAKIHEAGSTHTPLSKSKAGSTSTEKRGHPRPTDQGVRHRDAWVSLEGAQESPKEIEEHHGGAPEPDVSEAGESVPWDRIPEGERVSIKDIMCRGSDS